MAEMADYEPSGAADPGGQGYELLPFRLLLDRVIPVARPHFRTIFPSVGLPIATMAVILGWLQNQWMQTLLTLSDEPEAFFGAFAGFMAVIFGVILVYTLAYAALASASVDAVLGRPVDMGRAWRFALRPRTWWTLFLLLLSTTVALLFCIVPVLVVWPLLSLALPVMVAEGLYGVAALKRSAALVWWNGTGRSMDSGFLQVAVMLFVGWLVQNAVSGLVQTPMALLQQYWIIRDTPNGVVDPNLLVMPLWIMIPTQILVGLAAVVTWFYWTFGFSLLYTELLRRRYGADLEAGIGRLTAVTGAEAEGEV